MQITREETERALAEVELIKKQLIAQKENEERKKLEIEQEEERQRLRIEQERETRRKIVETATRKYQVQLNNIFESWGVTTEEMWYSWVNVVIDKMRKETQEWDVDTAIHTAMTHAKDSGVELTMDRNLIKKE